jgi:hypothetical protein
LTILLGVSQWTAQGVSLFAIIPMSLVGSVTHWRIGQVELRIIPWLWIGIALGAFSGGLIAHNLSGNTLRLVFAFLVLFVGLRELLSLRLGGGNG